MLLLSLTRIQIWTETACQWWVIVAWLALSCKLQSLSHKLYTQLDRLYHRWAAAQAIRIALFPPPLASINSKKICKNTPNTNLIHHHCLSKWKFSAMLKSLACSTTLHGNTQVITINAYNLHAKVLENATGILILSLYKVKGLAESITQLYPKHIDMCPKSCIVYTRDYADLQSCSYISSTTKAECKLPQ